MEKNQHITEKDPQEKREDSIDFTRHSIAGYKTNRSIIKSDKPDSAFNKNKQITPDLTEAGVELARQEAEKFFEALNPEKDVLFFVSSNETRAIETGNIYRGIAKVKGFEVIKPKHARSKISEDIAGSEIRILNELSVNSKNVLIDSLFNTPGRHGEINWEPIDPQFKARYDEASKIIERDDKGTFGLNWAKHGDKIKEFFPEIQTAEDLFKRRFQNLKKLAKFGVKKAKESGLGKNIKILAFGHENYLMYAIQNIFQEEGIKNCETMHIKVEDNEVTGEFRGKEANL